MCYMFCLLKNTRDVIKEERKTSIIVFGKEKKALTLTSELHGESLHESDSRVTLSQAK